MVHTPSARPRIAVWQSEGGSAFMLLLLSGSIAFAARGGSRARFLTVCRSTVLCESRWGHSYPSETVCAGSGVAGTQRVPRGRGALATSSHSLQSRLPPATRFVGFQRFSSELVRLSQGTSRSVGAWSKPPVAGDGCPSEPQFSRRTLRWSRVRDSLSPIT